MLRFGFNAGLSKHGSEVLLMQIGRFLGCLLRKIVYKPVVETFDKLRSNCCLNFFFFNFSDFIYKVFLMLL